MPVLLLIGAKPNLYCEALELMCGGSPIGCGLVESKAQLFVLKEDKMFLSKEHAPLGA